MSIRTMSVFMPGIGIVHETSKTVLNELLTVVRECQTKYGGKTELATEQDSRIIKLCMVWEKCLGHGLKLSTSILKNVSELVTGGTMESPCFWEIAAKHLTAHERERFSTLRHVWTDRGKLRALIRAALNERSLERYVLFWLNDLTLKTYYEDWALLRNDEATNLLPTIAAGLNSILFALTVDSPSLNILNERSEHRAEPIIAVPHPTTVPVRLNKSKAKIISFDADSDSISPASSAYGSVPKSLSEMCLKPSNENTSKSFSIETKDDNSNITSYHSTIENVSQTGHHQSMPSSNIDIIYRQPELPSTIQMIDKIEGINDTIGDETYRLKSTSVESSNDSRVINTEVFDNSNITASSSTSISTPTSSSSSSSSSAASSKHSSIHSSMQSLKSTSPDTVFLKNRLQDALERCAMLENRVAELSLENHRLRALYKPSRHAFNYFTVSVPRAVLQRKSRRKFYAYEVHIIPAHGGDEWTVLRRYSEFYQLHKHFQKDNVAIKTLDFPPKKQFGNMDAHFVEQRRQRLQVYLRHLLAILPDMSTCTTRSQLEQVFPFFK